MGTHGLTPKANVFSHSVDQLEPWMTRFSEMLEPADLNILPGCPSTQYADHSEDVGVDDSPQGTGRADTFEGEVPYALLKVSTLPIQRSKVLAHRPLVVVVSTLSAYREPLSSPSDRLGAQELIVVDPSTFSAECETRISTGCFRFPHAVGNFPCN